jgi:WD40 repeat protein
MMGDSNNVATFLFTQDSVIDKGLQRMPFFGKGYIDQWGQMVFNQTGSRLATTSTSNMGDVFLADFDRCYGILSNYKKISAPILSWEEGQDSTTSGLAFSPNGRYLYVTKYSHVLQYDLQQDSWYVVSGRDTTYNQFNGFFTSALAPDGKIYIGNFHGMGNQMSTINNPDQLGAGCNFCPKCFRAITNSYKTAMSVPPCMPNYELGAQVCWPLEVNEVERENVKVYPNPASNQLNVSYHLSENQNCQFVLCDLTGRIVIQIDLDNQVDKMSFSLQTIPKGIYVYRFESKGEISHSGKLIIE